MTDHDETARFFDKETVRKAFGHNGLTQEDYVEFRESLGGDRYDGEKAERILRERTWKHLGKRY